MLAYRTYSPGGNATALVEETVPAAERAALANRILQQEPDLEQVGFLSSGSDSAGRFRLDMMGDEFCANAARCAAFWWSRRTGELEFAFSISGLKEQLTATVQGNDVSISLPGSFLTEMHSVPEGWLIDFQGIRAIVTGDSAYLDTSAELFGRYTDARFPALALVHATMNDGATHIRPLVHVAATDTLIDETACGSGSIAAALVAEHAAPATRYDIRQPSGSTLTVTIIRKGTALDTILCSGPVAELATRSLA